MATTPTQLPVPSEKPQDLKFNAGKIDEYVTSMGWTYTDRFGVKHYTIEGNNYLAQRAMAAYGYVILTDKTFTTGATVNNPNEVLLNTADGEYYKWTGSFASGAKVVPANSTPESTGGVGPGKWIGVGDAALRAALASPDGAKEIGFGSTTVYEALTKTVKYFGAKGDGVTDDSQAFIDGIAQSQGKTLVVPKGNYIAKNINVSGCRLQLEPGAKILSSLGSTDNAFTLGSDGHVSGGSISVSHSSAPQSGNYGNAVRFGDYVSSHAIEFNNCSIKNIEIICTDTVKSYWAIEVLGRVTNWDIEDITFSGNWGAGIITHWGGDVDPQNPDSSPITFTYHPHKGRITNITASAASDGVGGSNLLILSAVFDVKVRNVKSEKWDKSLWITVGDVFNDVAVDNEKNLIMTGIVVDGMTINNPSGATSSPVVLNGVNTVNRTPNAPIFMHNSKCSVKMTGIIINLTNGNIFNSSESNPKGLISSYYFGDAVIEFKAIGFENSDAYLYQDRFSCNVDIKSNGTTKLGAYTQGPYECIQNINSIRDDYIGNGVRAFFMSRSTTLAAALNVGDTSVSIAGFGDVATFPKGTRVYITDDQFVVFSKTTQVSLSGATVKILKSNVSASSGSSVSIRNEPSHTKFYGLISGVRTGILADYTSSCTISMSLSGNGQYDIAVTSSDFGSIISGCTFENGGLRSDIGTSKGSISIAYARNTKICNNNLECGTGNSLPFNINITSANSYGVIISGNSFGLSTGNNIIVAAQSDLSSAKSKHSIYGNNTASPGDIIAPSSVVGQYVGSLYVAYVQSIPTAGTWKAGDKAFRKGSAIGQPKGWECTSSGAPGTWVSTGNL